MNEQKKDSQVKSQEKGMQTFFREERKDGQSKSQEKDESNTEGRPQSQEKAIQTLTKAELNGGVKSQETGQQKKDGPEKGEGKKDGQSKSEDKGEPKKDGQNKSKENSEPKKDGQSKTQGNGEPAKDDQNKSLEKAEEKKDGEIKSQAKSEPKKDGQTKSQKKDEQKKDAKTKSQETLDQKKDGQTKSQENSEPAKDGQTKSNEKSEAKKDGQNKGKKKNEQTKDGQTKNQEKGKQSVTKEEKKDGQSKSEEKGKEMQPLTRDETELDMTLYDAPLKKEKDGEDEEKEELDIMIMKQKEYLFQNHFVWNGRVKWDIVKSDVFSQEQTAKLQQCHGRTAGYQGLIEALKEAEGAEDLADLAVALQPTNPDIAAELSVELDMALGLIPVPQCMFREAVKVTRTKFGRLNLPRDVENATIRLVAQRMVYAKEVSKISVELTKRKNKNKVSGQDFGHKRIERLGEELERLLSRLGYDTAATATVSSDKKKNAAKSEKKRRKSESDKLAPYKKLESMLDVYFQYSNDRHLETKKLIDERDVVVKKVLKKENVEDLAAAIEDEIEKRQAKLRDNPTAKKKKPVTEEDIEKLEQELTTKEKDFKAKMDGYREKEYNELKEKAKPGNADSDKLKAKRKEMKEQLQEENRELESAKRRVDQLEKVLKNVLKNANY